MRTSRVTLLGLLLGTALSLSACSAGGSAASGTVSGTGASGDQAISTGTASAQAAALPHPGRLLASNCFQCHGTDGRGPGFDTLAGKSASELYAEMKELQTETELDEAIMRVHAESYTDDELRQMADYLSKVR